MSEQSEARPNANAELIAEAREMWPASRQASSAAGTIHRLADALEVAENRLKALEAAAGLRSEEWK